MPIFSYFAVVGSALVALLFVADFALPKSTAPVVVTSSFYGMPKPWKPEAAQTLVTQAAPEPDMTSAAVMAAMPKAEPVNERNAKTETASKKKHVARKQPLPGDARRSYAWSRNGDPFGGGFGGGFGRF